jgi:LPXTG-site transpeptidase (sortase) family protein
MLRVNIGKAAIFTRKVLRKKVFRQSLWAVAFIGYMFSIALILRVTFENQYQSSLTHKAVSVVAPKQQQKVSIGLPVRLKISGLSIDASIASAGLTADGTMDIPKDPDNVAWYNLGPRPGEVGSAVIAGHYGWENGHGSIFNNLHTLVKGDKISIDDEKGVKTTFVVRENRLYDPNAEASSVFRSRDGKSHLNLVTCEGVWDQAKQSYSNRLVVFTDKE